MAHPGDGQALSESEKAVPEDIEDDELVLEGVYSKFRIYGQTIFRQNESEMITSIFRRTIDRRRREFSFLLMIRFKFRIRTREKT